jgi:catechol 2,3-dioxygenase-like lactoylglutathione lyase family enzyme
MPIGLDHTIIPSRDQEAGVRFMAKMFGLPYEGKWGHFSPLKVNDLSLDWDTREHFEPHHYAFLVTDEEFDAILGRVQAEGIPYGSGPRSQDDMQINHLHTGRGFYFRDADGHSWEMITHTYV